MLALATSTTACAASSSESSKRRWIGAVDPLRVQIAEDQVGVADGRLRSAETVARGAWLSPRAPRPDLQRSRGVDERDRAAAGADRLYADRGQPDGIAAELALARGLRHAVGDEAHVGSRAAHVEGERARQRERAREVGGRRHARGRTRHRHRQRARPRGVDRHHAAGGVQEMDRHGTGARGHPRDQVVDVAGRERHDRRVQHGRAGALVLAELGVDLARDRDVRKVYGERLAQRLLVRRIRVGVQQTDRDALHAVSPEALDDLGQLTEIQRRQHGAVGSDALADLGPKPARHQRLGLGRQIDAIEVRPVHAADLEHVAEAAGGDEADGAHAALDDRIGDERGAVGEGGTAAGHAGDRRQAVEHAARGVGRRGRHLERRRPPGRVAGHEIGEGAADVDADPHVLGGAQPCLRSSSRPIWRRCTSSGPSAKRRVRECAHIAASGNSWLTPPPP